jgi:hypothetical protein
MLEMANRWDMRHVTWYIELLSNHGLNMCYELNLEGSLL